MKIKKSHLYVCFKVKNVEGNFFEMIFLNDQRSRSLFQKKKDLLDLIIDRFFGDELDLI
jgi:hypothetical protein